jgi:hypothetical protein
VETRDRAYCNRSQPPKDRAGFVRMSLKSMSPGALGHSGEWKSRGRCGEPHAFSREKPRFRHPGGKAKGPRSGATRPTMPSSPRDCQWYRDNLQKVVALLTCVAFAAAGRSVLSRISWKRLRGLLASRSHSFTGRSTSCTFSRCHSGTARCVRLSPVPDMAPPGRRHRNRQL